MTRTETRELAATIVGMLPRLSRQVALTGREDPIAELPIAQVRVCAVLADGPRAMSDLGRELGVSLSAVTQTADRLESAGMVERLTEEGDRRVRLLRLTPQADTLMHARREARVARVARALDVMPTEQRARIREALTALHAACTKTAVNTHEKPED